MYRENDKYYIPLQTVSDFLIAPVYFVTVFYNGENAFICGTDDFKDGSTLSDMGMLYYSAQPVDRSPAFADYCYGELCLMLDCMYGLKDTHDIRSFGQLFWQIGFDEPLSGTGAHDADQALARFIDHYLDDIHSYYCGNSWMTGLIGVDEANVGPARRKLISERERYMTARSKASQGAISPPCYHEIGNTAYLTLDNFRVTASAGDYYTVSKDTPLAGDTISMIIYAHKMITRENSPIENVVVDLSCNTGGSVDAGLFLISWFLGEAPLSVKETFTGGMSTARYRADVNLDRTFDVHDCVTDKNLFCLISPVSFSCANLAASVFKSSGKVTLLGRPTGGGSCFVQPMSTAWGTRIDLSGSRRMAFLQNGSFYDIDRGVEPDILLARPASYYDREQLTETINAIR